MPFEELLKGIQLPTDIKSLSYSQLDQLSGEIRNFLIESVSKTGGHLASNLGTVELTLAIHKMFDVPQDQLVWDVGHQSYTHKILTGRKDNFHTLRQEGGISGFPRSSESEYDAFLAGHSSTSISAALGLAKAKSLAGDPHYVIAVIGDGALTSGLAYEGINNAGRSGERLIIILNDNAMSISKNVGALARYLSNIRSAPAYFSAKKRVEKILDHTPIVGKPIKKIVVKIKRVMRIALYHTTFFEDFGFDYLGPVDGHNIESLCDVLEQAKQYNKPVMVHVDTTKGKGYKYAEENPGAYHGISKFDITTGDPDIASTDSFSTIFGKHLTRLARENPKICAITAAMKYGTGLQYFSSEFKSQNRFFDVGIAESHAVTFSAGLAAGGMVPVFAVYSTFLQRSYDQIIHDASIDQRHIILAIDRAGIVGDDGETHQGLFDAAYLSTVPNITVYSPATYRELEWDLEHCISEESGVCAVRYPRGTQPELAVGYEITSFSSYLHIPAADSNLLWITYGREYKQVSDAAEILKEHGVLSGIIKLNQITPIPQQVWSEAMRYSRIIIAEEGILSGGIGEHLCAGLLSRGYKGKVKVCAVDNQFVSQASIASSLHRVKLDAESLVQIALQERDS